MPNESDITDGVEMSHKDWKKMAILAVALMLFIMMISRLWKAFT